MTRNVIKQKRLITNAEGVLRSHRDVFELKSLFLRSRKCTCLFVWQVWLSEMARGWHQLIDNRITILFIFNIAWFYLLSRLERQKNYCKEVTWMQKISLFLWKTDCSLEAQNFGSYVSVRSYFVGVSHLCGNSEGVRIERPKDETHRGFQKVR